MIFHSIWILWIYFLTFFFEFSFYIYNHLLLRETEAWTEVTEESTEEYCFGVRKMILRQNYSNMHTYSNISRRLSS